MAVIDYKVSRDAMESEIVLRTSRLISNTRRSVTYFLEERVAALNYVSRSNTFETLRDPERLRTNLASMQESFGGFVDLGVIDNGGAQIAYVGPYALEGRNYSDSDWFKAVLHRGIYVSDVFKGFRNVPHMVIAVKHDQPGGRFFVLRATLDLMRLDDLLLRLEIEGEGDAFLINREGVLQTPSRIYGNVLNKINLPIPEFSERTQIDAFHQADNDSLLVGYAYITPDTPFILMIIKPKEKLMEIWHQSQARVTGFLLVSIFVIVVVILYGSTYLVSQIYKADQRRLTAMHQVEYAHKMASLGRLSAGVAHEINNPLAVIGEKAGLAKDLLLLEKSHEQDPKMVKLISDIISSVERCSSITHRLLGFARHSDIKHEEVNLEAVVKEVLSFMGKEAEYRSIDIHVTTHDDVPPVISDRGRLQEVLLNLFTNAYAAMEKGGVLTIDIFNKRPGLVAVRCEDTGCGIPESDLERIFEPFFSTKTGKGGTGLGLSITYRLMWEMGGRIDVESEVGKGTVFTVILPTNKNGADLDKKARGKRLVES
jgi:signal transduction histidine kinase